MGKYILIAFFLFINFSCKNNDISDVAETEVEDYRITILKEEKNEINDLFDSIIIAKNEQNRNLFISELTTKYPNFFKNIDLEKLSDKGVNSIRDIINEGYEMNLESLKLTIRKEKAQGKIDELEHVNN